ncbi:hypothetical protein IVB18_27170 [Bradyrhizobium sp. 186]|uniref:hypothetical protein n=1 Tax=Bradyrhizobium sp. 186 TaxID=2782654 RepID=UPI0020007D13|nr:hypothetical protein [Bradyrhizobium sp. 186]UPK32002.1 hypothetical protein IVB18_27170 [Bradyrhizobium sp. 186]
MLKIDLLQNSTERTRLRVVGRTEANEKTLSNRPQKGAGGGALLAQVFQFQMNGRQSVSPIARRIKPKRE